MAVMAGKMSPMLLVQPKHSHARHPALAQTLRTDRGECGAWGLATGSGSCHLHVHVFVSLSSFRHHQTHRRRYQAVATVSMDRPLHADDIVVSKANQKHLAVVERTHADIDTHEPYPGRAEHDVIRHAKDINVAAYARFMRDGVPPKDTVLVRWTHIPNVELILESKLRLLDRSLLIGDVVKRSSQEAMSGVVINTFTKCTLLPMGDVKYRGCEPLKGLLPPGDRFNAGVKGAGNPPMLIDIPASELIVTELPAEEDLLVYKDWIGRIEAVTYNIALKLSDGMVVEIGDEHAEHADGTIDTFKIGDIAMTKKGTLRNGKWIFGQYNPNTHPIGTVVQARPVATEVTWLQRRIGSVNDAEPPSLLEREELESEAFVIYDRTRRPVSYTHLTLPTKRIV